MCSSISYKFFRSNSFPSSSIFKSKNNGINGRLSPQLNTRNLSSGEVFTALKPFFFAVHPDLFGQFPKERAVNENSLKQLNAYIESPGTHLRSTSSNITFYLRNQDKSARATLPKILQNGNFESIRVNLGESDVRRTVHSILQKCNLPTSYIDNLPKKPQNPVNSPFNWNKKNPLDKFRNEFWSDMNEEYKDYKDIERDIFVKKKFQDDLETWLEKNAEDSKKKLAQCWPIREEIVRLKKILCQSLSLQDILWECGWSKSNFRGCLESLNSLSNHHPDSMSELKGRTVIFGLETGINLEGCVILNSGAVRNNWMDLITNVHKSDEMILRIPSVELALSKSLCDIRVVHRKFEPKRMVECYESQLRKLTTAILDYRGRKGFPRSWPEKLSHLQLVVETDAGPLMVSPTGQIIVPSSCPPFLLVNFITQNSEEASKKLALYKKDKYEEVDLHERCIQELGLVALEKDDSITPNLMISCLKRLIEQKENLGKSLKGTHLWITTYYSVLSEGEICIPWNWKDKEA